MDTLQRWIAMAVAGVLAVVAAGWLLLISPERSEAALLREEAASQRGANQTLRTRLQVLKAQAKDLPRQRAQLNQVAAKIPTDPALAPLVRALGKAADRSSVRLVSIAPLAATELVPAALTPPATQPRPGETPLLAPAVGVVAGGVVAGAAGAPVTATTAAAGESPYVIPLTITVEGDYFEIQLFLSAAEQLSRAMRVTGLSILPAAADESSTTVSSRRGRLRAEVSAVVFFRPDPFGAAATAPPIPAGKAVSAAAVDQGPPRSATRQPAADPGAGSGADPRVESDVDED